MRAILAGLATAVVVTAVGGPAAGQDGKIDGKLLVGKWTPDEKGKTGKFFLNFTDDGKLGLTADTGGGKEFKVDGTYKLDGAKLTVHLDPFGDGKEKAKGKVMTVNSLTAKELVTTDEDGKKETMIRAGDEAKKKKKKAK